MAATATTTIVDAMGAGVSRVAPFSPTRIVSVYSLLETRRQDDRHANAPETLALETQRAWRRD